MKRPNTNECDKRKIIVQRSDGLTFAIWHPQWGGYAGRALVTVSSDHGDFSCFEVTNWHDGNFPTDETPDQKHYCSPMQLADFAVAIMEKQATMMTELPTVAIERLRKRLAALVPKKKSRVVGPK